MDALQANATKVDTTLRLRLAIAPIFRIKREHDEDVESQLISHKGVT